MALRQVTVEEADEYLVDERLSRQLGARSESRLLPEAPFRHSSLVFAIRCTQTLLKRLAAHPNDSDESEATTVLGDWYVNTLNVGRLRLLLCSSERSLLTAIIPAAPLRTFPERLEQAVARILAGLPITASAIARERKEMTWHRLGRTRSRHVLGSMNDCAYLAEHCIRDDGPHLDLERIAGMLNHTRPAARFSTSPRTASRRRCSRVPTNATVPDEFESRASPARGGPSALTISAAHD